MEKLCNMAYFGKDICDELVITEKGSFENIWKNYDEYEPMVVLQLKKLYITNDFMCPGSRSFLREIFPNCKVFILEI